MKHVKIYIYKINAYYSRNTPGVRFLYSLIKFGKVVQSRVKPDVSLPHEQGRIYA